MSNRRITAIDAWFICIVAICISCLIWIVKSYVEPPQSPVDKCWYEIKYLHVSGREITKRVFMTCEGFHHWYMSERYKVPAMVLPFPDGSEVTIQGATDILSVVKFEHNE